MTEIDDRRRIRQVLNAVYDRMDAQPRINPGWLATEVCKELDGGAGMQELRPEMYRLAHEHVKQMARALCRRRFEGEVDEDEDAQAELFEGLQHRYPAARRTGGEPEYVLLDHMNGFDFGFNVERLQREVDSKQAHIDALKKYWNDKQRAEGGNLRVL